MMSFGRTKFSDTPRMRSEISGAMELASIMGLLIGVPLGCFALS